MTQTDQAEAAAETAERTIDPATVVGWGVDADPENDPTWPMRDRTWDDGDTRWARGPLQTPDVEILESVEHLRTPAAVGTSTPPRGLSGMIRRNAYARFSESQWGHWLLLMLADRIDTVEGLMEDLRRGKAPNPLVEMGYVRRARSREAAVATGAVAGVVVLGALYLLKRRRPR